MLKITLWENSEKDVICLLDCKIGLGWHVTVSPQFSNSSGLIYNAVRMSTCPSGNITDILETGSSIEEGNTLAAAKASVFLLAPRC